MIVAALVLLMTGILLSLFGHKLFRIFLPLLGLVGGSMVGFVGFQGVFGKSTVSTTVAIFVALVVGLMLSVLSFLFFELAVTVYTALLGASALSYLGIALGLGSNGFVLFLLSVAGFVIGLNIASSVTFSTSLVIGVTSFAGVALILASIFLVAGNVSADQLNEEGVIRYVLSVVDQSLLWLFVWLSGSIVAVQAQKSMLKLEVLSDQYQFKGSASK